MDTDIKQNRRSTSGGEKTSKDKIASKILEEANLLVSSLVEEVEASWPGHRFGRRVNSHMETLAAESDEISSARFLSVEEARALKLALRLHDVGRIVCQLERPGDKEHQFKHGEIGAEFIERSGLLDSLCPKEREAVLIAIKHHSDKRCELEEGSIERHICDLIRDFDKKEILSNEEAYLSPQGALNQIGIWMLSDDSKRALEKISEVGLSELLFKMKGVLCGEEAKNEEWKTPLEQEIHTILTCKIPDKFLEKIKSHEPLSYGELTSSYPAYMLAHVLMFFDIRSTEVKRTVLNERLLERRLTYLEAVEPKIAGLVRSEFE